MDDTRGGMAAASFVAVTLFVAFLGLIFFLLVGCATQPPEAVVNAHSAFKLNRYAYYAKSDYRPLAPGEPGNCARFAASYQTRLKQSGIDSQRMVCMIDEKTAHAFVVADGWVLDNRFIAPVRIDDVGCIGEMWEGK